MLNREWYLKAFSPEMVRYLESLPYDICREKLYTPEDITAGADPARPETIESCFDAVVFRHSCQTREEPVAQWERWAQSCHDTAITNAVNRMLQNYNPRKVVGIMGGHILPRSHESYRKTVLVSKKLTEMGFLLSSGGGPGAMEAVHLGSHFAWRNDAEVDEAIKMLSVADFYSDPLWMSSTIRVKKIFPADPRQRSLAIPTWLFGHEPPNIFASDIAKFFSNSIREDTLLTTAFGGIILMPGSAGTFREIFQKIVPNHYLTWKYPSPMIFIGRHYWTNNVPLYPVIRDMLRTRKIKNLLTALVDDIEDVLELISDFENLYPLIRARGKGNGSLVEKLIGGAERSEGK